MVVRVMKRLEELRERVGEILADAKSIQETADAEERPLSESEEKRIQELLDEHESLVREIERRERLEEAERKTLRAERRTEPVRPEETAVKVAALPRRYPARLRAFRPRDGESRAEAVERAYRAGMWVRAVLFGDQRAQVWCREHGIEVRAQEEGVGKLGGFLVPTEFESAIIDLREEYGVVRKYAKVKPMGRDVVVVPRRVSGVVAYAVAEGGQIPASEKQWDQVQLIARKWAALVKVSSELAEDAVIDLAEDLAQEIAYAFAHKEDDAAFNGDGTSAYHGIVGLLTKLVDGNHGGSCYTAASADVFSEITAEDLANTMALLPGYVWARGKPRWYCPVAAKGAVFDRLALAAGGNTARDLAKGPAPAYAGLEIVPVAAWSKGPSDDLSGLPMILVGDLSMAVTLGDRRGTALRVSHDRYLEYDQIGVVGTCRFDVNVHSVGDSSNAGPIVALIGA